MSNQPQKIDTHIETSEGYEIEKRDDDLIQELIEQWNNLVDYLGGQ